MKSAVRDLERRLVQATSASECLATLLDIANHHAAAFHNREGLRAAREALNIARVRSDSLSIGRALGSATLCHYQRGDYVAAVATGLDAVEAYADGDLLGRSHALQSIALALLSVEQLDLAESVAARAVADARASGDAPQEAGALCVHGSILADQGHFNAARRQFRRAGATFRLQRDPVRQKKAISNLGHTYRNQADAHELAGLAQGRFYLKQALRVYGIALATGRTDADADDAIILGGIAECECRLGNLDAAFAAITRALALARDNESLVILAPCMLWEGRILKAMGDLDGSARALERAVQAAESLEDKASLAECLVALCAVEDQRGRFERATDLERRAARVMAERATLLARVRTELGPLWERYTAERPAAAPGSAA